MEEKQDLVTYKNLKQQLVTVLTSYKDDKILFVFSKNNAAIAEKMIKMVNKLDRDIATHYGARFLNTPLLAEQCRVDVVIALVVGMRNHIQSTDPDEIVGSLDNFLKLHLDSSNQSSYTAMLQTIASNYSAPIRKFIRYYTASIPLFGINSVEPAGIGGFIIQFQKFINKEAPSVIFGTKLSSNKDYVPLIKCLKSVGDESKVAEYFEFFTALTKDEINQEYGLSDGSGSYEDKDIQSSEDSGLQLK